MLTKPQVFYDNNLKQAPGFQNPFYLKKAQQIRSILYDGNCYCKETNVISIADSEETLMLKEESRSKMLLKQSDPMVLEKKVNTKPINYAELNRLSEDFGKCFVPQRELSDEQALHPITDQSASSLSKFIGSWELPKKGNGVPHHGLDLWLQIQNFYDHVDGTTQKGIDYASGGRLIKPRPDEAWAAIERLAQYDDKGWIDAFIPDEVSLNYENPNIKQLLGIMERKFDTLMKDAISLMGKSESIFRLTTNEMYRPPSEPSQEFMEFSSEVARRLKERIQENENKPRKIKKITKYQDTKVLENSAKYEFLENLEKKTFPTSTNLLCNTISTQDLIFKEKMESQSESTQTLSTLKLPMLKIGDYDLWSIRIEQYLTHTNYALWEVIVNGDAPAAIAPASAGTKGPIPPKTVEQKLARKN
ncbi:hypothetical protein Tco_0194451 [Tanacetum coccineum]